MCFIFQKPATVEFPFDLMALAHGRNNDGFGIMFMENGKAHQRHLLPKNFGQVKKLYKRYHNNDIAVHFRMQTVGKINTELCHPFKILDRRKHGISMYMMHNGTISCDGIKSGFQQDESDTLQLVKQYLHPILKENPELIHQEPFKKMLSGLIGISNRLVFLDDTGKFEFINRSTGYDLEEGVWLSNLYGIPGYAALGYDLTGTSADLVRRDPPKVVTPINPTPGANTSKSGNSTPTGVQSTLPGMGGKNEWRNYGGSTTVNPTSRTHPSPSAPQHVPSSTSTYRKGFVKVVTTQSSEGTVKHIIEHNNAASKGAEEKNELRVYKQLSQKTNEDALKHISEDYTENASYDSMVEILVGMTEEEVWNWVIMAPEEASSFIHTSLQGGNVGLIL